MEISIETRRIDLRTAKEGDVRDITADVQASIDDAGMAQGTVCVFAVGSTASITTLEYEPGLKVDLPAIMERLIPSTGDYVHEATWHDDNGHSHLRASIIGPSITVPIIDGRLALGTWQQIVLIEWDTRPRDRVVLVQMMGSRV